MALHAARVQADEVPKLVGLAVVAVLVVLAAERPGSPPLLHTTYMPFTPVDVGH